MCGHDFFSIHDRPLKLERRNCADSDQNIPQLSWQNHINSLSLYRFEISFGLFFLLVRYCSSTSQVIMRVAELLSDLTSLRVCVGVPSLHAFCSPTMDLKRNYQPFLVTFIPKRNFPNMIFLSSLCEIQDHDAALALVSCHRDLVDDGQGGEKEEEAGSTSKKAGDRSKLRSGPSHNEIRRRTSGLGSAVEDDGDLQRALDLMELHYGVKEKHIQGIDMGLQKARHDVEKALGHLNMDVGRRSNWVDQRWWWLDIITIG